MKHCQYTVHVSIMWPVLLAGVCSVLLLIVLWKIERRKRYGSLDQFPGPRGLPIIGNVFDMGRNPVELLANLRQMSAEYGPIVKLWVGVRPFLFISDVNLIQVVLSSTKHIDKSLDYDFLHSWLGTGLLLSTGSKWKTRRKILTPAFHFKILEQFVDVFNKSADILIEKLSEVVDQEYVDIYPYITRNTLDIICETAMGTSINAQNNIHSTYVAAVEDQCNVIIDRAFSAWKQFNCLFIFSQSYQVERRSLKILHDFTDNVIVKRREELSKETVDKTEHADDMGIKKKVALLDLLLQSEVDGQPLSDAEIREEVDTFMFAGHDTTASGLSFCLYEIANNPDVQVKILNEINTILAGDNRPLTFRDLSEMKYLEMVIKEGLRMYPSVPFYARELVEDLPYNGINLPKGLTVDIFAYDLHRSANLFPDPNKFNPDRFLPENVLDRNMYSYVPFSAGPRNCIGQKFAILEIKATIAKILCSFELCSAGSEHAPKLSGQAILKPTNGVHVSLHARVSA